MSHVWKKIKGYEENYLVSSDGRIYSLKTKRILKNMVQSNKRYFYVALSKNGFVKNYRVHRLVATAFIPNKESKEQVNHIDFDVFNNKVENLEWATISENMKHSADNGRVKPPLNFLGKFGVDHNKSKSFKLKHPNGEVVFYGSGLEMKRKTKQDDTTISYARRYCKKHNTSEYAFTRGGLKGYIAIFS